MNQIIIVMVIILIILFLLFFIKNDVFITIIVPNFVDTYHTYYNIYDTIGNQVVLDIPLTSGATNTINFIKSGYALGIYIKDENGEITNTYYYGNNYTGSDPPQFIDNLINPKTIITIPYSNINLKME